ncbi:undecaprenyl/decaprenyl-phosphate alpha-N-acetylglucosaminyl 1-phosphate transferase [Helicobacter marmotae]|uniref:Undecaprenyl/decaprenyl-phosphate alpha-N-acetylglucosaminyl 1-phosphate transferase n=2 Tax=Helicobacter marmotae TaxID=152490 RepID=A0A3D8I7M9_9HELI|nr:undecaprenyl/decaprenyl-phosphate alpha-N-acetylglucosaminyl 1-phosphate transferase [Helicobacter marmotae]
MICFVISLILCVGIILISRKYKIFIDSAFAQKPQRFHTQATPRAGGIGIFSTFCIMVALLYGKQLSTDTLYSTQMLCIVLAGGVIFASGIIEDFRGNLSPKARLLIQCTAIFCVCAWLGVYLKDLSLGFSLPYVIGLFFTTFALVGVSNAINIIDGFNGLASGVCLLILCGLAYVAYQVGDMEIFYIALALIGAIGGFFICNFPFGYIFLGDGGAYFLGFIIGILLVLLTQRHTDSISAFFGLSIMIYPVWEVLFSIWRRKKNGANATSPDDLHLHTLLFRVFKSNALTSGVILCAYIPIIVISICFYAHTSILLIFIVAFTLLYFALYSFLSVHLSFA